MSPVLPSPIHISALGLGFAVVIGLIALAQRLGDWRSKPIGASLGTIGGILALCWVYFVALWVLQLDLLQHLSLTLLCGFAVVLFLILFMVKKSRTAAKISHHSTQLTIEDFSVHVALNLKVTSACDRTGSALYLTRVTKWRDESSGYGPIDIFRDLPGVVLLGNDIGLPSGVARTFQLLEFTNPARPIIRTKLLPQGGFKEWPISNPGIWRMDLQLRWDGGEEDIVKCFRWTNNKPPVFVDGPQGDILRESDTVRPRPPEHRPNNRIVEGWQKVHLMGQLRDPSFSGTKVILLAHSDDESVEYATQLRNLLFECNWLADGPYKIPLTVSFWDIQISQGPTGDNAAVLALYNALVTSRIRCRPGHILDPNAGVDTLILWVGVSGPEGTEPGSLFVPTRFDPSWIPQHAAHFGTTQV